MFRFATRLVSQPMTAVAGGRVFIVLNSSTSPNVGDPSSRSTIRLLASPDAGRTWRHLGLRQGQQISQIVVDPRNPDRLFVAVLGHPYGPNSERGLFRSIFLFPYALSFIVTGVVWRWIFTPSTGVNLILNTLGVAHPPKWITDPTVVGDVSNALDKVIPGGDFIQVKLGIPLAIIPLGTLNHFAKDLGEAGKNLEAAVDWNGQVTYYSKAGIMNPRGPDGNRVAQRHLCDGLHPVHAQHR